MWVFIRGGSGNDSDRDDENECLGSDTVGMHGLHTTS